MWIAFDGTSCGDVVGEWSDIVTRAQHKPSHRQISMDSDPLVGNSHLLQAAGAIIIDNIRFSVSCFVSLMMRLRSSFFLRRFAYASNSHGVFVSSFRRVHVRPVLLSPSKKGVDRPKRGYFVRGCVRMVFFFFCVQVVFLA